MKIAVPKENHPTDRRIPLIPAGAERLVKAGAEVLIEKGLGETIYFEDKDYQEAGAAVSKDRQSLLSSADMILRLHPPPESEIASLQKDCIHISFLDPFNEPELVDRMAAQGIRAISMEMIPRTTKAQKMDALSSQANLAGYMAVVIAARKLFKIFPMMTTPAGTIKPARVFVIGAGVAGLQAIATAKRLGAIVEAYDTRPVVEEQVRSLGGRFVKFDIGETGETEQGYAKELTPEQLARQQEAMARHCEKSDVVITTAQLFGRKAPRIVTSAMVERMKPGSVIVDLAVESGGNVEGSETGKTMERNGVQIVGLAPLPGEVALDASQMYSNNLVNLVTEFWDTESKEFKLDVEDEIIQGCLITNQGKISNEMILKLRSKA